MQYVIWKVQECYPLKLLFAYRIYTVIPIRLCSILYHTMNTTKSPTICFFFSEALQVADRGAPKGDQSSSRLEAVGENGGAATMQTTATRWPDVGACRL